MAIDNQFGKGIGVAAGFDLGAQKPLDARVAVNTIAERDAHVTNNRAYEGMLVFVDETKLTYQLVNGEWKEFGFNQADFDREFAEAIAETDNRLDTLEGLVVGGEGEGLEAVINDVASNKAAIEKLNGADNVEGSVAKAVKNAIDAEAELRAQADEELQDAIDLINNTDNGILAQAKAHAEAKDLEDRNAQALVDQGQNEKIAALEAKFVGEDSVDAKIAAAKAEAIAAAEEKDKADRDAQSILDSSQGNRIDALEAKFEGENSVDNKIAAVQSNLDDFENAQDTAHQALVQKDGELDQAIKDEAAEARKQEGLLQNAIDAINNADNGILAQAKAADAEDRAAQLLVDQEQDRRLGLLEAADENLQDAIDQVAQNLADFKGEQDIKEAAQDKAIEDEAVRADAEEKRIVGLIEALQADVDQNEADCDAAVQAEKERAEEKEGELLAAINKEVQDRKDADNALDGRLQTIEGSIGNGGNLESRVAQAESDIDKIQEEIGVKAEYDENGDQTKAADGIYKYIDDADTKSRNEIGAAVDGIETAVAAEKSRAEVQEAAIRNELAAEKLALQGEIDADVKAEKERAEAVELKLNQDLAKEIQDREAAVSGEVTARENADNALNERLLAVEASVGIDGGDGQGLASRVAANEAAIEVINGEGEGSIKKAVADLIDGAPEATDTLNELAKAIKDNKDVYDGWVVQHEQAMSQMKSDLQAEIDADVKVVADELAKQKDAEQEGTLANQIKVEKGRAEGVEAAIRGDFAAADDALKVALQKEIDDDVLVETNRAKGVEEGLQDAIDDINDAENGILAQAKAYADDLDEAMDLRMDAVEGFVKNHDHSAMEGRIEALENANKEGAVASAIKAAQDAADQAQREVDAVEGRMDTAEGEIDDLQEFVQGHSHSAMEQGIADNKAAIEVLNGDENKAGSVAAAVKVEADRAKLAEEAIQKQINEGLKCVAFDGDQEYTDLAPLA